MVTSRYSSRCRTARTVAHLLCLRTTGLLEREWSGSSGTARSPAVDATGLLLSATARTNTLSNRSTGHPQTPLSGLSCGAVAPATQWCVQCLP
ncbi:exported hypothetical protein [Arthrobacter sp. 9AX]|nr:exported hypothetical protein [Arthrobacter sp. 9AX]